MKSSRLDQFYLNSILSKNTKDSNQYMNRWSFFEFLVRLAKEKYLDRKLEETLADSL
jgi:hypothetical protein